MFISSRPSRPRSRRKRAGPTSELLAVREFPNGAPGLIDGHIRIGAGAGIGIGDGNPAERLAPDDPGFFFLLPIGIEQWIRRESVTMRPASNGDALDVLRRVESRSTKHAAQLVTDVSLEFRKGRLQQLCATGAILVPLRQSGLTGSSQHEQDRRLLRVAWKSVLTEAHREIQRRVRVISAGRNDMVHIQLCKGGPAPQRYVGVYERGLH